MQYTCLPTIKYRVSASENLVEPRDFNFLYVCVRIELEFVHHTNDSCLYHLNWKPNNVFIAWLLFQSFCVGRIV